MHEIAAKLFSHFLLIYLFLTADIAVLTGVGVIPRFEFSLGWEVEMLVRSAVLSLPGLIFSSSRELSDRETIVRRLMHFIIIEAEVFLFVFFRDGVRAPKALAITVFSIFIAYLLVLLGDCFMNFAEAERMNRLLKEVKKKNK